MARLGFSVDVIGTSALNHKMAEAKWRGYYIPDVGVEQSKLEAFAALGNKAHRDHNCGIVAKQCL